MFELFVESRCFSAPQALCSTEAFFQNGLRRPHSWLFNLSTAYYRVTSSHTLLWGIFVPYIRQIVALERDAKVACQPRGHSVSNEIEKLTAPQKLRLTASIFANLLRRNSVIVVRKSVVALP